MARAVESGSLTVLDLSAALGLDEETHAHDPAKEEAHTHEEESDPHIWTSFRNAENMCRAIAETLCARMRPEKRFTVKTSLLIRRSCIRWT